MSRAGGRWGGTRMQAAAGRRAPKRQAHAQHRRVQSDKPRGARAIATCGETTGDMMGRTRAETITGDGGGDAACALGFIGAQQRARGLLNQTIALRAPLSIAHPQHSTLASKGKGGSTVSSSSRKVKESPCNKNGQQAGPGAGTQMLSFPGIRIPPFVVATAAPKARLERPARHKPAQPGQPRVHAPRHQFP